MTKIFKIFKNPNESFTNLHQIFQILGNGEISIFVQKAAMEKLQKSLIFSVLVGLSDVLYMPISCPFSEV